MSATTRITSASFFDSHVEIITYSLRDQHENSQYYYRDVSAFTDQVVSEAQSRLKAVLGNFRDFLQKTMLEDPRSTPEYVFDLLTLGVLWKAKAYSINQIKKIPQGWIDRLVKLRKHGGGVKAIADMLRGILSNKLLLEDNDDRLGSHPPTKVQLDLFIKWLRATNTYTEEVKRLEFWQQFLDGQPSGTRTNHLVTILDFADWFEQQSETALGLYTPHVDDFVKNTWPAYRWREDYIFCGRLRAEYHLNMVGTEILNRAFRQAFLETQSKIVIAPPCMCAPEKKCEAQQTSFGSRCAYCTPSCRVNQLTKLGEKYGFQVMIMPDELTVFSGRETKSLPAGGLGVVGIACVLTNAAGGWETKDLGIPAQGVLLDYCGCPYHWHKKGIPTDINFEQLLKVVGVKGSA